MSNIKSPCPRIRLTRKRKKAYTKEIVGLYYTRPKKGTDLKREGRFLDIIGKGFAVRLNGTQINSIKTILSKAGEVEVSERWRETVA